MRVNLPAIGQAYKHDDLRLSAQTCKNWYPEINQETSIVVSLQQWPGAKMFASGSGSDRGMCEWNGLVYKVTDTTLYRFDGAGNSTTIGSINGTRRCSFSASTQYLVIVTSGLAYVYDGSTLTPVSDSDLESPNYGAYLNSQWIYQGQDGRFGVSDAGDPFTINSLNYATAESNGDPLVRPYVLNQILYLFGTETIEQWYNSGVGDPPFDRIEQGIIQKGLGAADSLAHNDRFIYFLGDDRLIYQLAGNEVRSISTPAIARAFDDYVDVSNAIGYTITLHGQEFYFITIPNTASWVFNEATGGWFELTTGVSETPSPSTSHVYSGGKHLIADGGNILEMDDALNTCNGQTVIRERATGLISGELFGPEAIGKKIFMSRLEVLGTVITPVGIDPVLMVSYSDDAGYTWSNERHVKLAKAGDYTRRAVLNRLGSFYNRVFRFRVSDDVRINLHRVSGDITFGNN